MSAYVAAAPEYRNDIDGLRTIAVLIVALFHFGMKDWKGGFVGVDVFFVISGYLILGHISDRSSRNDFKISVFYANRFRRLFPALIPALAFSTIVSVLLLTNSALLNYAPQLRSAALFHSNYTLMQSGDYFANDSRFDLLLHTWSLSIEWQLYFIAPLILVVTPKRFHLILIAALSFVSFVWSEISIQTDTSSTYYYSPFCRFWEFGFGGITSISRVTLPRSRMTASASRLCGLVAIFTCVFMFGQDTPFPGFFALAPVLGATILVARNSPENPQGDYIAHILGLRVPSLLGRASYSIYLWHWPIAAAIYLNNPLAPEKLRWIGFISSIVIGILSYLVVEKRMRVSRLFAGFNSITTSAVSIIMFIIASYVVTSDYGLELRNRMGLSQIMALNEELERLEVEYKQQLPATFTGNSDQPNDPNFANTICSFDSGNTVERVFQCVKSQASSRSVIIIGDSHGRDFREAARQAFPSVNFVMAHESSCVPAEGAGEKGECFPELIKLLERVRDDTPAKKVILDARWGDREYKKITTTVDALERLGFGYLIVGPTPLYEERLADYMRLLVWSGQSISQSSRVPLSSLMFDWNAVETDMSSFGGTFLPVMSYFCNDDGCKLLTEDNHPVIWDREHFTLPGIKSFAEKLARDETAHSFLGQ